MPQLADGTGRRTPCPEVVPRHEDMQVATSTLWHVQLAASTPESEIQLGYDVVERELHEAIDVAVKWAQDEYPDHAIAPRSAFAEAEVGFKADRGQ